MRRLLVAVGAAVIAMGTAAPAVAAPGPPDTPEYWFDQWNLQQLWASGVRGQGVVIGEIDTGVNADLSALSGKVLSGKDFGTNSGDGRVDRDLDAFGHGTAMASLMVAGDNEFGIAGVAPDAKILPVAIPLTGTTDEAPDDHLPSAIKWAADHRAKIITMSLGGTRTRPKDTVSCASDEQDAVDYALRKGAIVIAAAGNRGKSDNAVESPAVCLGVIAVGAVDSTGAVADFSSRHPYLTLVAPGVQVPSLGRIDGEAYRGKGTSQATALVTASIALVWSKYPKLTGNQVVARVLATLDGHTATRRADYGFGTLNAYRAVTAGVPLSTPNPLWSLVEPFLARDAAEQQQTHSSGPKPVVTTRRSLGEYSVGSTSPLWLGRVLWGLSLAAAGLLALVVLAAVGLRRRRRDRAGVAAPAPLAAAVADPDGVVWHQILTGDGQGPLKPTDDTADA